MSKLLYIFFIVLASGCILTEEREANLACGNRYIPMLKEYISKDENINPKLKYTYIYGLDEWHKMLKEN